MNGIESGADELITAVHVDARKQSTMASATFQTNTQTFVVSEPTTSSTIIQGTESPVTTTASAARSTATATAVYPGPIAPSAASSESVSVTANVSADIRSIPLPEASSLAPLDIVILLNRL